MVKVTDYNRNNINTRNTKSHTRFEYFQALMIILACMNFLESGALIMVILGLLSFFYNNRKIVVNTDVVCMLIFAAGVFITSIVYGRGFAECVKAVNFVLTYLVGYYGYLRSPNKAGFIRLVSFSAFFGSFVQLLLHYIYNYGKNYGGYRIYYSFWTARPIAVTCIGLISAIIIGYSFYGIFLSKKTYLRLLSAAAIVLTAIINLNNATRTPIVMLFLCYFIMLIVYFRTQSALSSFQLFVIVGLVILFVLLGYFLDIGGLKGFIDSSALIERFEGSGIKTSRVDIAARYFEYMPRSLFGGEQIKAVVGRSAHNYIQEAYDLYGLIPLAALLVFSFRLIGKTFSVTKEAKNDKSLLIVIALVLVIFVQSLLEPIMTGYPIIFWVLIMYSGIITAYLSERKGL